MELRVVVMLVLKVYGDATRRFDFEVAEAWL